ncbi:MAG TPA: hypothetical protein VGF99_03445 [Myxococcota bacterium]
MIANFTELLGANTCAARDRTTLLCSIGALGREVSFDVLVDHMASVVPAWTWEMVGHAANDLADGGALERLRDERGFVVGWRITDDAARWLLTATMCAVVHAGAEISPPAWLRAWMREPPAAPKPTTTSSTAVKAVTPC